jgi:glycine/D-amino acid oxidase-like deaminating enzyme
MIEQVFWQAERECKAKEPPVDIPLPDAVDVAVIGGGLTGLSAARTLAKGGASVAVFETNSVGWGASGRNGGQVSVGGKRGPAGWAKEYGQETAARLFEASKDSVTFVEDVVKKEKIDCGWVRSGKYGACYKSEHFGQLAEYQKYMADTFGYELELVPPLRQKEELGSDLYHGGIVDEFAGMLNPYLFARGLAAAALKAKALIFERTEVLALAPSGSGWTVTTPRGTLRASDVFVATNGYTGDVTSTLKRRVVPVGSHIIATEPLDKDLALSILPKRRICYDTKKMLFYFVLSADDRLVFGGRAAWRPLTAMESGEILRRHMVKFFPQLAGAKVEYTWHGQVCMTRDFDPHLGKMDGLYYSLGYCGHGVALSAYLGDVMARVIAGKPEDNAFLELKPLPRIPGYTGNPWFLPAADIYYRTYDRLR